MGPGDTQNEASDQSLPLLVEMQAARTPTAVAVASPDDSLTYRTLNARANQLARRLQQLGVGRETRVGLYVDRTSDLLVSLLAILKTGGAYVPCQGRSKIRPPWRRKTRPLGSGVEWRNAAVRRGRQDAGVAAGWRAFLLCSRR